MTYEKFVLINLIHKSVLEHQNSKECLRLCSPAVSGLRENTEKGSGVPWLRWLPGGLWDGH